MLMFLGEKFVLSLRWRWIDSVRRRNVDWYDLFFTHCAFTSSLYTACLSAVAVRNLASGWNKAGVGCVLLGTCHDQHLYPSSWSIYSIEWWSSTADSM